MNNSEKLQFWNSRANLDKNRGTNDFILKQLELSEILQRVALNAHVLDVGCGSGETIIALARGKGCTCVGIDFAEDMICAAKSAARASNVSTVRFEQGDLSGLAPDLGVFDYVLTERSLINLDGNESQRKAFGEILSHVRPGGCYLMVESFIQGLDRTNDLRKKFELDVIKPPWHNVFMDELDVKCWGDGIAILEEVVHLASTYHLLSRVVYAKLAKDKGEDLCYDSDINRLAAQLPAVGNFGPVQLWVWRKTCGTKEC